MINRKAIKEFTIKAANMAANISVTTCSMLCLPVDRNKDTILLKEF
jgi:hypothetical protein